MKIFITGISGFIGYHLARKLFSQGHHVLGIDSYNNYYDVSLKEARLESNQCNKNFKHYLFRNHKIIPRYLPH